MHIESNHAQRIFQQLLIVVLRGGAALPADFIPFITESNRSLASQACMYVTVPLPSLSWYGIS